MMSEKTKRTKGDYTKNRKTASQTQQQRNRHLRQREVVIRIVTSYLQKQMINPFEIRQDGKAISCLFDLQDVDKYKKG